MIPLFGLAPVIAGAPAPSGGTMRSMLFDGATIASGQTAAIPGYSSGVVTFAGWARGTSTMNNRTILADTLGTFQFFINSAGTGVSVRGNGSTALTLNSVVSLNTWFHFCITIGQDFDSGGIDIKMRIDNGTVQTIATSPNMTLIAPHTMYVGEDDGADSTFPGYLADVVAIEGEFLPTALNFDSGNWQDFTFPPSTAGFRLAGTDAGNPGADISGNTNDFTSSGGTAITLSTADRPTTATDYTVA